MNQATGTRTHIIQQAPVKIDVQNQTGGSAVVTGSQLAQ